MISKPAEKSVVQLLAIGAAGVALLVSSGISYDPIVKSWKGENSSDLGGAEIAIVVTLHDVMDKAAVLKSAGYVFDATGKLPGAVQL